MKVSLEAMEHYGFVVAMLAFAYMGYSVRSESFRYTAWLPWDGETLTANWSTLPNRTAMGIDSSSSGGQAFEELYDHQGDMGQGAASFDNFENVNLAAKGAGNATTAAVRDVLLLALKQRFLGHNSDTTR